MLQIRTATPDDANGILEIYAPHVIHGFSTFESEVPTEMQMSERIKNYGVQRPWLLCTIDNKAASYAYASMHRERTAYQWSCECSVYTHERFQGRGLGSSLYELLFELLKMQGYRNVYAGITLPNEASIRLHEACGFTRFAVFEKVGFKLGEWKDVGWYKLRLNNYDPEPTPPLKFSEMDPAGYEGRFTAAAGRIREKLIND